MLEKISSGLEYQKHLMKKGKKKKIIDKANEEEKLNYQDGDEGKMKMYKFFNERKK